MGMRRINLLRRRGVTMHRGNKIATKGNTFGTHCRGNRYHFSSNNANTFRSLIERFSLEQKVHFVLSAALATTCL